MAEQSLKLISSMAVRGVLAELVTAYEHGAGRSVHAEAAGGVKVAQRLKDGEVADVVVLAGGAIDKLFAAGVLVAGSRRDFVRSSVSIAVPAGSRWPDIATPEALRRAVLAAPSLSYSTGPSGVYLEQVFERWGILEEIRGRIVVPQPGIPVASLVAKRDAMLGFQQLSELMNVEGVDVVGPLPPEVQKVTIFAAAVSTTSRDQDAAMALVDYLVLPEAAAVKQRHGMDAA